MAVRRFLIITVLSICLLEAGWEIAGNYFLADVTAQASVTTGEEAVYLGDRGVLEGPESLVAINSTNKFFGSIPESHYQQARIAHELKKKELLPSDSCADSVEAAKAARLSPANSAYQIAWALFDAGRDPNQLVCGENFSGVTSEERILAAITLSPSSARDTYQAGVSLLDLKEKPRALELFKRSQLLDPLFTEEQRDFVYDLVTTEMELENTIPPHYPQVAELVEFFGAKRPADLREWNNTFVSALNEAITELDEQFRQGQIKTDDFFAYIKRIERLPTTDRSEDLRIRLDKILANLYLLSGNEIWAAVLSQRADLQRLPVLKSLVPNDKNGESMLFGWQEDGSKLEAGVDRLGQAIGFFVPEGSRVERIILESSSAIGKEKDLPIRLFVSTDNHTFHPFRGSFQQQLYSVDGREIIVMTLSEARYRYFKIVYDGSVREPKFANSLGRLLQIYGKAL